MVGSHFTLEIPLTPFDPEGETETARRERIAAIEALVPHVFKIAALHLGGLEARRLFIDAVKTKRAWAKHDAELLRMHDAEVAKHPEKRRSAARTVAERLHSEECEKFGHSADAIRKHISRLVKRRRDREEAAARRWETFLDEDGNYPGLLGNWVAEALKKQSSTNEGDGQN
jgi:hypothetical protein